MTFEKTALADKCISAWFGEPPALCLEYALRDTLANSVSSSKFWAEYIEYAHVPKCSSARIFYRNKTFTKPEAWTCSKVKDEVTQVIMYY